MMLRTSGASLSQAVGATQKIFFADLRGEQWAQMSLSFLVCVSVFCEMSVAAFMIRVREADYAESMSKRITAESDRRIARHAMNLFGSCAGIQRFFERCIEILNTKIDMYRRPVALVLAHIIAAFCRGCSGRLGQETNC
jgi:hypothetical protein